MRELDYNHDFTDPGERAAIDLVRSEFDGGPVLDLGVGLGRTINILKPLTSDYRAIDYLPAMVEICRKRYPDACVELGDARTLHGMPEQYFSLVQFSFNGIDAVTPSDRLRVLASVYRVLKPNGVFLFSTINLHGPASRARPWHIYIPDGIGLPRTMVRTARSLLWLPFELIHWHKLRRLSVRGPDFMVAPLAAHHWGVLAHFTSYAHELKELRTAGFTTIAVFDNENGERINTYSNTSHIGWFHFVARKYAA
jgi:SAM-dependent methyltransferase